MIFAHAGQPPTPHDLWTAWNANILLIGVSLLTIWTYRRGQIRLGRRPLDTWRARSFAAALVALGVALLSPLDALSSALASAHMVQHLLLALVAAPLLAFSAPTSVVLRGAPWNVRYAVSRWRRRFRGTTRKLPELRRPASLWLLHVGTLWFWHAAVPYDAAVEHSFVHAVEHASFLLTGVLFWRSVIGTRNVARASPGLGVILLFAMALQSAFLSVLLTFARTPWYGAYTETTQPWGLEPLADQQIAGAIMWVPAGMVYLAAALALLVLWIRRSESEHVLVGTATRDDADARQGRLEPGGQIPA